MKELWFLELKISQKAIYFAGCMFQNAYWYWRSSVTRECKTQIPCYISARCQGNIMLYIFVNLLQGLLCYHQISSIRSWLSLKSCCPYLLILFSAISAWIDYCLFPHRLFLYFKTLMWSMTTFQPQIQKNKLVWEEEDRMVSLSYGIFQTPAKFSKPLSREDFHKNFSLLSFFKTLPL